MPYWSSSRVGAVPQPQANNNGNSKPTKSKRSERFGRQKGITMEDLKKQTALRLAQEQDRQQQQQSHRGGFLGRSSSQQNQTSTRSSPAPTPPPPQQYAPSPPPQAAPQAPAYSHGNSNGTTRTQPPRQAAPASNNSTYAASFAEQPATRASTTASKNSGSSKKQAKSKLPHGLTVQELKEMTKARLQAEAASKNQQQPAQATPPPAPQPVVAPPPQMAAPQMATQQMVPTQQPPMPVERPAPRVAGLAAPPPPGFHGAPSPHPQPSLSEPWPPQEPRPETWETSFVEPPGMAPPPGLPPPQPQQQPLQQPPPAANSVSLDDFSSVPFARTSSFGGDFEANRRRAATMSPSLSIYEDRELADFPPVRERAFSSDPPAFRHLVAPPPSHSVQPMSMAVGGAVVGNRARTSSAASLPPMSHTADEFGLDTSTSSTLETSSRLGGGGGGSSFGSSHFGAVREEFPVTPGLADVFRVSSFDQQEVRMRASTWSEPMLGGGSDEDDLISDDLASILKLSGAEDKSS